VSWLQNSQWCLLFNSEEHSEIDVSSYYCYKFSFDILRLEGAVKFKKLLVKNPFVIL
jgi:hypothetical protein